MNNSIRILGLVAAAGGAAWLAKFALIAATDGAADYEGATAALYFLGVALMAIGAATVTLRAVRDRGTGATAAAALLAPVLFVVSFMLLDPVAQAATGDAGPDWMQDESAIALTGLVWLAVGVWSQFSAAPRPESATSAA